jgi:high-affinity iron transporter
MFPAFILTLREGLEAALIIGIVLGVLTKIERPELKPLVWMGAGAAFLVSVLLATGLTLMDIALDGRAGQIFEGVMMLTAAAMLTWMIFWMAKYGRFLSETLKTDVRSSIKTGSKWALFSLAFFAVAREGAELALLLTATSMTAGITVTILGAVLGLALSFLLAWLLLSSLIKLNIQLFFKVTNVLLILFAAGLVAYGVHELNEALIIPGIIEHVWDINWLLDEKSTAGQTLKVLFGYNGNPSLTEVMAYVGYLAFVILGLQYQQRRPLSVTAIAA